MPPHRSLPRASVPPGEAACEAGEAERAGAGDRWALVALLAGAAGIAFAPIFVRLSELPPTATAFHRLFLALPPLWLWKLVEDRRAAARRQAAPAPAGSAMLLVAAGLFFAGDLALWHWSIRFTTVANATLLANFAPIFVTLAGYLLFSERFSRQFLLGMAFAILGAGILMGESLGFGAEHLLGDILGLITAVFYAGYILSVAKLRVVASTATIMAWSGLVSCGALLTLTLLLGETLLPVTPEGWAVLFGLALLSHAGGQSLIAFALARLPAALSSVSLLLQPAIAAVLAWAILAEPLGPWQMSGALVILGGIYLAHRGSGSVR